MIATLDLSIVMPCLNEARTLESCISKAHQSLKELGLSGEIVIADNGSTDGSIEIAKKAGARIVNVTEKGYGHALRAGIEASQGRWIIMGDADDSYDFSKLTDFTKKLEQGYDLVMGCRLPSGGGTILPGAMPWKHRWIGNPVLSNLGRLFFHCPIHDFHCGLRGFQKDAYARMDLRTTGMELASEMVVKATLAQMRICEVPITLHKDGRLRPPHLRSWRDGWRHLRFMLLYSPRWLFLIPGITASAVGAIFVTALSFGSIHLGKIVLDVGSMAIAGMLLLVGVQLGSFALYSKVFAVAEGLLPQDTALNRWFGIFTLERGLLAGGATLLAGFLLFLNAWAAWKNVGYGALAYDENLRRLLPAVILITLGVQVVFSSFFMSVLGLKTSGRTPPALPK